MTRAALRAVKTAIGQAMAVASWAMAAALPVEARSLEEALASVVTVLPEWPADARRSEEPEASGVVWRGGRHVATAYHAVGKALSVRIRTSAGEVHEARLAGFDAATDLAVLAIDAALPPAEPSLRRLRLGERVCAIGNAFGLGASVTCGVVSGIARSGVGFNPIEDFVQTDAAVNPGASGGALVDGEGALVGVLSAIFTKTSDANIGVNFAISAALADRVVSDLVAHGRVRRAEVGLRLRPGTPPASGGRQAAVVAAVAPGSPAERAGVRLGDAIVAAGGRRVHAPADLLAAVALAPVPSRLVLEIEREGALMALSLDIAEPQGR